MALGAHDALPGLIDRTLIITKEGHREPEAQALPGCELIESSHPVPDARALAAGSRLVGFVDALPLTGTNKVQRGELKAWAQHLPGTASCIDTRHLKRRT